MGHNLSGAELEEAYERSLELEFEESEEETGDLDEERIREIARDEVESVLEEKAGLMESVSASDPSDGVPKAPDPSQDSESAEEPTEEGSSEGSEDDDSLLPSWM